MSDPGYVDQVPRLLRFREQHPQIEIRNPVDSRSGVWSAHRDGEVLVTEYELYRLLDKLGQLLGGTS